MNPCSWIGKRVFARIDRPLGSLHPRSDFIYPINYGYVPGVLAPDGEELDVYLLGVFEPVEEYTGECIAVVHRLDDQDEKLVLVPPGVRYSDDQILALTEFQERYFQPVVLRNSAKLPPARDRQADRQS
jgi:inorganic pyrophosphatase